MDDADAGDVYAPPRRAEDWRSPPAGAEIDSDTIHVWRVDSAHWRADPAVLSPGERERAARFRFEHLRTRFVAAHHSLRTILARYIGVQPASVLFRDGENGKPYLDGSYRIRFNLSHSGDISYIAVGSGGELGVDVELAHKVRDVDDLARSVLSVEEREQLARVRGASRDAAFLCAWTRKEAFLKALALGITVNLPSITVGVTTRDRLVVPVNGLSRQDVCVRTLACGAAEHVAVACAGSIARVMCFEAGERI
jgi:4'-phosphopantetheinyl transferase